MAGHDNSFEQQMIDFYGGEKINEILNELNDNTYLKFLVLSSISMDIAIKFFNVSKHDFESTKNKMQIEMYEQLEKDRQYGNK